MWRIKIATFIFILLFVPAAAFSHSGGTDAYGCHTCRTNCASWGLSTGEYHCHNAKQPTQPKEPVTSTYGENGTGYTEPEPDYKYSGSSVSATSVEEEIEEEEPKPTESAPTTSEETVIEEAQETQKTTSESETEEVKEDETPEEDAEPEKEKAVEEPVVKEEPIEETPSQMKPNDPNELTGGDILSTILIGWLGFYYVRDKMKKK